MSATGRSDVRRADDFYATPEWCTRAILPYLHVSRGALDPCCGTGAILDVLRRAVGAAEYDTIRGIELDADRARCASHNVVCADALELPSGMWGKPSLVVTNPPYRLAMQFVARALLEVESERGVVAMLLRLNWLGSQARASFHRTRPSEVYILPRRPSFTGGGTDAIEYAWFVWRNASPTGAGKWRILDVDARGES